MDDTQDFDEFGPSAHKGQALDYIANMLSELSEMAAATGETHLADLIRDSHRLAKSNDDHGAARTTE